jgi:CubicO group peptidase (beta-lactamase class C family)
MTEATFDVRRRADRVVPVRGVSLDNRLTRWLMLRFLARATLPGGGLFGPAEDVLRFGRAMLPRPDHLTPTGPRVLSQAAIDEMTREQTTGILEVRDDGTTREPHYALGWGKPEPSGVGQSAIGTPPDDDVRVPASASTFTHGGASGGRLWVDPGRGLVFVFLTNAWGVTDAPMWATLRHVVEVWDAAAPSRSLES